jgi:hypothetical protein
LDCQVITEHDFDGRKDLPTYSPFISNNSQFFLVLGICAFLILAIYHPYLPARISKLPGRMQKLIVPGKSNDVVIWTTMMTWGRMQLAPVIRA